jgi:hypothetical protein
MLFIDPNLYLETRLQQRQIEREAEWRRQLDPSKSARGWRWPFRRHGGHTGRQGLPVGGTLGALIGRVAARRVAQPAAGIARGETRVASVGTGESDLPAWPWLRPVSEFPTLRFIDRALGDTVLPFSGAPNALDLEALAREVTAAYWTDLVWQTGMVSEAALRLVVDELELHRRTAPAIVEMAPAPLGSAA